MHRTTFHSCPLTRSATLVSLLGLLTAVACRTTSTDSTEIDAPSDTPSGSVDPPGSEPSDDYSAAELDALANTPDVQLRSVPFADAPPSDESFFVSMSDGVRLAVNLYFPPNVDRVHARLPVAYVDEWYGHAEEALTTPIELYRAAGFVVAMVDGRGFGASFGSQEAILTARARQDQNEMLAWLATQPWSNGSVSVIGLSLSGNLAAMITGGGSPDLQAAIIHGADFDEYSTNMFPGGVPNTNMLEAIALGFLVKTRGEPCVADLASCASLGVQPVDADADLSLLQAAFVEHAQNVDGHAILNAIYRDDTVGSGRWSDMTPVEHPTRRVPTRVSAGWLDGTTSESALLYFASHPNTPLEVVIGPNTHLAGLDADPFSRTAFGLARPAPAEAFGTDIEFLERVQSGAAIGRSIRYFVLGADAWNTTQSWPPAGVRAEELFLLPTALVTQTPSGTSTLDYRIDPNASSGAFNRWGSQRGGPIYYGDRRTAPGRRLAFDAAAVTEDTELAGTPELCLALTTDQPDGLVVAYLEDVAPDGRVTYLTEGELRLLHRATRSAVCDPAPGAERSFTRADAAPVIPGERLRVEIPLLATAALVRQGHHLRLSLAGADAGTFPSLTEAPANWSVHLGGSNGSTLRIPTRAWVAPARD